MFEAELFARLIIPDSTAITAFHTLKEMGYKQLKGLKRELYYKFYAEGSYDNFKELIGKVDILVNYNKNRFSVKRPEEKFVDNNSVRILLKSIENDCAELLSTLKNRLGFSEIKKMERGVVWIFEGVTEETAKEMTEKLLSNKHYQDYKILN